ncbi:MAG: VTT domain-containing protein [Trueperaceae bacterium]|nr:VTT domain-containing protein [Trueperaceae bacterium]
MTRRRVPIALAVLAWTVLVASTWTYLARADGGSAAGLAAVLALLARPGVGVPVLLAAFAVRPVLLLPVTVLTAFSGWWLGPWLGFAVAWVAVTLSASVPYATARALRGAVRPASPPTSPAGAPARAPVAPPADGPVGAPVVAPAGEARAEGWRGALARDPFRSVLVARLMMLHGDLVSAAAGALRVPWGGFLAATAIGGAPGLAVGVLAGASLPTGEAFALEAVRLDPWALAAAVGTFAVAWGVAVLLRRRSPRPADAPGEGRPSPAAGDQTARRKG